MSVMFPAFVFLLPSVCVPCLIPPTVFTISDVCLCVCVCQCSKSGCPEINRLYLGKNRPALLEHTKFSLSTTKTWERLEFYFGRLKNTHTSEV